MFVYTLSVKNFEILLYFYFCATEIKFIMIIKILKTSMSLSSEQPPPSAALPPASQTPVFQPVSKSPHSSGINVNAAPFQSMQTVRPLCHTHSLLFSQTHFMIAAVLKPFHFSVISKTGLSCRLEKVFAGLCVTASEIKIETH